MATVTPTMDKSGGNYPINADNGNDIYLDTGPTQVLTAPIAGLVAGSPVQILAGTTGKKVRIHSLFLTSSIANGTVQFQDETGSPVKYSGVLTFAANGQLILPHNKFGWMDFAAGAAVDIAITGSSNVVGGSMTYSLH